VAVGVKLEEEFGILTLELNQEVGLAVQLDGLAVQVDGLTVKLEEEEFGILEVH
jgi:hypothetical protein